MNKFECTEPWAAVSIISLSSLNISLTFFFQISFYPTVSPPFHLPPLQPSCGYRKRTVPRGCVRREEAWPLPALASLSFHPPPLPSTRGPGARSSSLPQPAVLCRWANSHWRMNHPHTPTLQHGKTKCARVPLLPDRVLSLSPTDPLSHTHTHTHPICYINLYLDVNGRLQSPIRKLAPNPL